jgi:hypothetical protein
MGQFYITISIKHNKVLLHLFEKYGWGPIQNEKRRVEDLPIHTVTCKSSARQRLAKHRS